FSGNGWTTKLLASSIETRLIMSVRKWPTDAEGVLHDSSPKERNPLFRWRPPLTRVRLLPIIDHCRRVVSGGSKEGQSPLYCPSNYFGASIRAAASDVSTWHLCEITRRPRHVRFRG